MALQLHKMLSSTSIKEPFSNLTRRPIMLHCKTPENISSAFLSFPRVCNAEKSIKCFQFKIKIHDDSCKSVYQANGQCSVFEQGWTFSNRNRCRNNVHLLSRLGWTETMTTAARFSSKTLELGNSVQNSLPYRIRARGIFFSKDIHALARKITNISRKEGISSSRRPSGSQKLDKPLCAHGSLDGGLQVSVPSQSVGTDPAISVDSVAKTSIPLKATEKGMSSSAPEKSAKSPEKQNKSGKCKVQDKQVLVSADISGAAKSKASSRTSKKKKLPTTPQTSTRLAQEMHPDGEEPVSLTKKQSQEKSGSTKKKKGSKTKTMVMTSDEVSGAKSRSVVGEEDKTKGQTGQLSPLYPPSGKSVVVVESLTKANIIQKYLGDDFEVLASYGHVRDLAARSGSVRPDDDFSMVWEVPASAWTHLKSIKVALGGAQSLILASDPDREGEAIAWHIKEMLQQQDSLRKDTIVARVVFHEITESSVKTALRSPRDINMNLVQAYLARRALDYLIGFNISPLLWRKLPGCPSAGRVQSAALALVCDRETEIEEFKPSEYWSVEIQFRNTSLGPPENGTPFFSHMTHLKSKKLEKFSISSHEEAKDIEKNLVSSVFNVVGAKASQWHRNSPAPYITSTLQQDAANKLHFSASYTMKLAQKLYEGVKITDAEATGLITYMRTDGLNISDEAVKEIKSLIMSRYGQDFVSIGSKHFKKVKNAQEAHEALRPTNIWRLPSKLVGILDEDSLKLYTLIWSRTMSCQMVPATFDQIQVDIGNAEGTIFRSVASKVAFLGYQAVYKDKEALALGENDNGGALDEAFSILTKVKAGHQVCLDKVNLEQHHTQPPPRYSEGSLVKKLEELGIGRPSTYASILKVLQDRNYVSLKSRVLFPEFRGRMVAAFLSDHFSEVTDYCFTADMENELDNVSVGKTKWKGLLKDYWSRFSRYCNQASRVDIRQVEKMLERRFEDYLFASLPNKNRTCPSCLNGTLIFKVSRFGAGYFIGCDQHPKCKYIARTMCNDDDDESEVPKPDKCFQPRLLGLHPSSNEKIVLKEGPYGNYFQLGDDRKGYSPKRVHAHVGKDAESITLEDAIEMLKYPVTLGKHPEDGRPVVLRVSQSGFTVRHRSTIAPVPKAINPREVTVEKAIKLLSGKTARQTGRPKGKPRVEAAFEELFS